MEATRKRKRRKRRTSVPWCANAQLARKAMRVGGRRVGMKRVDEVPNGSHAREEV
jgi:hypothetical protein